MAVAFGRSLGSATGDSSTTLVITTGAVANTGERIVVEVGMFSGGTGVISGVADSAGNTYAIDLQDESNSVRVAICSAHVTSELASAGTIEITLSTADSNWMNAHAQAYTGVASSSAVDTTDAEGFAGDVWATTATASSTADAVIVGCGAMRDVTDRTHTPGTNLTTATALTSGGNLNFASVYRILTSAASFNAGGTFSGTDFQNSNSAHVIYKGSGEAPPAAPTLRIVRSNLRLT
jgi:hypothetical protein